MANPSPTPLLRATAPLLLVWLGACGQWEDGSRANAVAREILECFDVTLERTEPHRFHATGCERHADIVCSEGSLEPVCIQVRERGGAEPPPAADTAEHLAADEGSLEEVRPDPLADDEAPSDEPGAVVTAGGEVSAAETAIRRGLDARADDVFSCVDRERVTVRITYHEDGSIRVALTGDLSGSPEEGCVRVALDGVRAPVGSSGVVLHPLRRAASPPEDAMPPPEPAAAPADDAGPGPAAP